MCGLLPQISDFNFKLNLLILWVAKLSKWVPTSATITSEDVQIPVMAKKKLSSIVIGCRLYHLKEGSEPRHTTGRSIRTSSIYGHQKNSLCFHVFLTSRSCGLIGCHHVVTVWTRWFGSSPLSWQTQSNTRKLFWPWWTCAQERRSHTSHITCDVSTVHSPRK